MAQSPQAIFDGPAVFFMFAFAMAAGAYLRTLSAAALEIVNNMRQGTGQASYPYDLFTERMNESAYSRACQQNIAHLIRMRKRVGYVSNACFVLMILFAARAVHYAWSVSGRRPLPDWPYFNRYDFDLYLTIALLVFVAIAWILHMNSRRRDKIFRERAEAARPLELLASPRNGAPRVSSVRVAMSLNVEPAPNP
jgi:hypothetical protein